MLNIFSRIYAKVMVWVRHRHAQWYLAGLSFAESSFFPVPPDVMLAPMALAEPARAFRFALITTVASVAGGVLGYAIGYFAFELVQPWIEQAGYGDSYQRAQAWFQQYGFWAVLLAGFSPIPYKVFTIAAGTLSMSFVPFLIASLVGRGARFYLVAALMRWGGPAAEAALHRYVDAIGWLTVLAAVVLYLVLR